MADIDSSSDLGVTPLGLNKTKGRCNYQWAIEGPNGHVIFYCTNTAPCDGNPHLARFAGSDGGYAAIRWANVEDIATRKREREAACAQTPEHCEHYQDWPPACDSEPYGDPGDGLPCQGVCCECGAEQAA